MEMDNVQAAWQQAIHCSLAEFLSCPTEANRCNLERLLADYREAAMRGEVMLYRPRAA